MPTWCRSGADMMPTRTRYDADMTTTRTRHDADSKRRRRAVSTATSTKDHAMGTTPVNTALGELHGKIDDYVFRNVEGATIVARKPRRFKAPPTDSQMNVRSERGRRAARLRA